MEGDNNQYHIHFKMLLETLHLLAASYEEQVQALPAFVHLPDEIALTFTDVYVLIDNLVEQGFVTLQQKTALDQMEGKLAQMSTQKQLWTLDKLKKATEWQEVRSFVSAILGTFHEEKRLPHLFWLQYISEPNKK